MSARGVQRGRIERKPVNTTDDATSPTDQTFMLERSNEWPEHLMSSARRLSREFLSPIVHEEQYPRVMSVVSGVDGRRPGLHRIISFAPTATSPTASATSTSSGLNKRQTLPTATVTTLITATLPSEIRGRDFNPLDPLGLGSEFSSLVASRVSVASSVISSGGSGLTSEFPLPSISLPGLPSPSGLLSGNGTSSSSGLLGALGSLLSGGLGSLLSGLAAGLGSSGLTQAIDDDLNRLAFELINGFISDAGIDDFYTLRVLTTCKGESPSNISSCSPFSSAANKISKISSKIPSSLAVVGTNVSSPALNELTGAVSTLGPTADSLEKFLLALMILSLINSAAAIILSFLGIFLAQNRIVITGNLSLATIGIFTRSLDAVLATLISVILSWLTNKFGNSVGLYATSGATFIALIWLGFVFQSLATSYWVCVWFVEFRQSSFRIRKREATEIGDYRGIFREIKIDVRSPKENKEQETVV
ncbi:uncharacterized protein LY89DRAFT_787527 [Mollisia scopiformis]|uniref:Uncharacterized protein n=1 Tax=Mollisia scopiformis TaxID=149040 RepID=A0A132BDL7_MOLSC|nr:uncharacterized protein LY89DRAFT_787527 [Mollisia scopiformis]KUJ10515.1 hypothetical protein LY89DRAFT_787527 [Mollisia scopiformis]